VLAVVSGSLLIVLVAVDVMVTLLHPTARGPLSYVANRTTWSLTKTVCRRLLGGRGLSYAGPLAVVINLTAWVTALWLGFALIYLPFIGSFSFDPSTPFAGRGFGEALYVSGASLTTVGFGDVVATSMALRLVTVTEAASGFGALSAAIAFVISIYPLLSQLRGTGIQMADTGALDLDGAARVVREAGPSELAEVVRELTENHEHLRRFPVLYYFESGNAEESLTASLRGSALLLVALHCAPPNDVGHARVYADVLERIVGRLLDDLERDFVGGRHRPGPLPDVPDDEAADRMDVACGQLAGGSPDHRPEVARPDLGPLVARVERVLEALAEEHGHSSRPLFSSP
jgi:Ion channel